MESKLTSGRVTAIFTGCLFKEGEDTIHHIRAEGIVTNVGFHPERLASNKAEIEEMLSKLPTEFQQSGGGGWSFLNACKDKNGRLWTGEQRIVEQLVLLGIAIERVKFQLPREVWSALPGGVPYFAVSSPDQENKYCSCGVETHNTQDTTIHNGRLYHDCGLPVKEKEKVEEDSTKKCK